MNQVWGNLHPDTTFSRHFTNAEQITILHITQTAMHYFQAVLRCGTPEITPVYERYAQSPQGSIPGSNRPVDTTPYYQHIENLIG
jgi:hypothetical protein